jgi:signal peptidase II
MILIILILYLAFKSNGIKKYSLLLIFGGAIGNLYDRIFYNAVPDFIDLHIGNFHWFIFNVADIFITIGVIFMILLEFTATNNKLKI